MPRDSESNCGAIETHLFVSVRSYSAAFNVCVSPFSSLYVTVSPERMALWICKVLPFLRNIVFMPTLRSRGAEVPGSPGLKGLRALGSASIAWSSSTVLRFSTIRFFESFKAFSKSVLSIPAFFNAARTFRISAESLFNLSAILGPSPSLCNGCTTHNFNGVKHFTCPLSIPW